MGRPIVYCGSCGKSLREEEFTKGRAHLLDNTPFCSTCRPLPAAATAAPSASSSSSTSRSSWTPATRRREASASGGQTSKTLAGGALLAALAVVVAIGVTLHGGGTPSPAPRPADPTPAARVPEPARAAPPRALTPEEQSLAAIRNLEAFASASADPEAILERCRETRAALTGSPHLSRVDAIESRAKEARTVLTRDRQIAMTLEGVQHLRDADPRFERREEVERLLRAAIAMAGPRKAEIEQVLEDYRRRCSDVLARRTDPPSPPPPKETPPPAPPEVRPAKPPPPAAPSRLGPYDLDDGAIRNWLVLGPFAARKDRQALYDHDLLKTEADHLPAAGQEVATRENRKVTWTPVTAAEGKVLFRTIESMGLGARTQEPAIVFAACWLHAEKECPIKFRAAVDSGLMMWLDHKRVWNYPKGQGLSAKEEVLPATLTPGPHLVLLKVVTVGGEFGFRLRVTTPGGERVSGIRVWNQVPVAQKILFAENFNAGRGPFIGGETAAGGADGTLALAVPRSGSWIDGKLPQPSASTWTLRFKAKPLRELTQFEVLIWSGRPGVSYWYHIRGLKRDEWNPIEVKASQLNRDWHGKGQTFEGDTAQVLKFYFDDSVPDGSVLIDDVEVSE